MEELLPDLPALAPGLGVLGLLGWLLVRVMRQSSNDRSTYQADLAALRRHHAETLAAQATRHDGQIAELRQHQGEQIADLRGQVKVLREELAELRAELETTRRARWRAEDAAARYRRQLGIAPEEATDV